jgi:hypothetical protein
MNDADPAGRRLPVKVDTTTNGEFAPIPLERAARHANAIAHERARRMTFPLLPLAGEGLE